VVGGEVTEVQYVDMLKRRRGDVAIRREWYGVDPEALAKKAASLCKAEDKACKSKKNGPSDSFECVFVVTDVDEFSNDLLRRARRVCDESGVLLIISNPCFEAWLIDHVQPCPETMTTTKQCQQKARDLGLVTGRDGKEIVCEALLPGLEKAPANARVHNGRDAKKAAHRADLSCNDFAPWTDMPDVMTELERSASKEG
jgi:hypothetical protein